MTPHVGDPVAVFVIILLALGLIFYMEVKW